MAAEEDGDQIFNCLKPGDDRSAIVADADIAGHARHQRVTKRLDHSLDRITIEAGVDIPDDNQLSRAKSQAAVRRGTLPATQTGRDKYIDQTLSLQFSANPGHVVGRSVVNHNDL